MFRGQLHILLLLLHRRRYPLQHDSPPVAEMTLNYYWVCVARVAYQVCGDVDKKLGCGEGVGG